MDEPHAGDGNGKVAPQHHEPEEEDDALVKLGEVIGRIDRRTRALVVEHPVLALSGAVAIGWVLGRLLARR